MARPGLVLLALLSAAPGCHRPVDVYPPEVVRNFMATCTTRSEERVCRCAIDALQRQFTLAEFQGREARMQAGEVPKDVLDAVAECRE
jgi:hypothetical protein